MAMPASPTSTKSGASHRPELLDAKVRLVNIGTHSAKIEVGLRQLFKQLGWECLYDVRLGSKHRLKIGDKVVPSVKSETEFKSGEIRDST